jgi:peptidoglycan hydrolase-like protein with peptidoglycan-binding domain
MAKVMLARGSKGLQVEVLQKALASLGVNPGPLDGLFGPKTEAAVKRFQKAENLEVDGVVGPKTQAAIDARKKKLDAGAQQREPAGKRVVKPAARPAAADRAAVAKAAAAKAIAEAAKKAADKQR